MIDILFLFDEDKPAPSLQLIILYTVLIIVLSNIIFLAVCKICNINPNKYVNDEKEREYKEWKSKNMSIWKLVLTEGLNTTLYSPIAEELVFRFLLMKIVLTKGLKLNTCLSNIIQSFIFGLLHLTNNSTQNKN